jgi:sporulation protein YlmC with PRC-barrel domain
MSIAEIVQETIDVPGGDTVYLVRDLLDKQLVDRRYDPMGRVDGILLSIAEGRAPQVTCIESGMVVAASRVNRRVGRWVRAAARRWGLSRGRPVRISWNRIERLNVEAKLDLNAEESHALAWEHWLLEHVVRHIPSLKSSGTKEQQADQTHAPRTPDARIPRGRLIRLQRLLGRKVLDADGRSAGRIEEVRAQVRDGAFMVESFELGRAGLLERLSISDVSLALVRGLGARRAAAGSGRRVPWEQLNLDDWEHPRLRCTLAELETMQPSPADGAGKNS